MSANDHKIIQALHFADKNRDGFSKERLRAYFKLGSKDSLGPLEELFGQTNDKHLFMQTGYEKFNNKNLPKYHLTLSGVRLLYNVEEIDRANRNSRIAIILSIGSILISTTISFL